MRDNFTHEFFLNQSAKEKAVVRAGAERLRADARQNKFSSQPRQG